jgi:hypothetical protein
MLRRLKGDAVLIPHLVAANLLRRDGVRNICVQANQVGLRSYLRIGLGELTTAIRLCACDCGKKRIHGEMHNLAADPH